MIISFENYIEGEPGESLLRPALIREEHEAGSVDVDAAVQPDGSITVLLSYDPALYRGSEMARLMALFENYVERMTETPDAPLHALPLLNDADLQSVLALSKGETMAYDANETWLDLFKAQAVNATLQSHPALLTVFTFGDDSELVQRYAPELFVPVAVEQVTEAELESLKETLVAPFVLINHLVFRTRIFRTEAALYFFIDINHLVADGTSMMLLLQEITDRYLGSGEIAPSEPDKYYLMLSRREAMKCQAAYAEDRAYYEKRYGGIQWSKLLNTEIATREDEMGSVEQSLKLSPEPFEALMRNSGLGKNGLFIAAELLALAAYNQARDVMISWVYKGRDDQSLQKTVGMLFREFPVAVRIHGETPLRELLSEVQDQISQGIVHSSYPWLSLNASPQSNDNISLNYQDMIGSEKELRLEMEELELPVTADASPCALEVEIVDDDGDIDLSATFSSSRFRDEEVARFLNMIRALFNAMLERRETLDIPLSALFDGLEMDFPCL